MENVEREIAIEWAVVCSAKVYEVVAMTFIRDHITHSPVLVHQDITLGHAEQ